MITKKRHYFVEFLFVLALATKPLYLRKSGSLQISDVLFVLLALFVTLTERKVILEFTSYQLLKLICCIIVYQIFVNFLGPTLWNPTGEPGVIFSVNLYYLFNLIVVYCVLSVARIEGFQRTVQFFLIGTVASIAVSLVGVLQGGSDGSRETGFFNNPNQLGYFCIVVMTVLVVFKRQITAWIRLLCFAICTYMVILSLSKAAIAAVAILLLLYTNEFDRKVDGKRFLFSFLGVAIAMLLIYVLLYADNPSITRLPYVRMMRTRMLNMMHEGDSDLISGRGYGRIKEIGPCLLFGVGEGMNLRFESLSGFEVHSTYASTLVSYGIIGVILYIVLVRRAIYNRTFGIRYSSSFLGIAIYSFTHNGIRSTLLWALLAMSYLYLKNGKASQEHLAPETTSMVDTTQ